MQKGKISSELLQQIRDAVNIVDVIGEHVVLRKSGSQYSGLCPFHSERTPSFYASETKQLYHCYGCKRGGDLFHFVMESLGISFPEAIEELAERGQIQLPPEWYSKYGASKDGGLNPGDPKEPREQGYREKLRLAYKLNRFAAAFFHQQFAQWPQGLSYLRKRGVSDYQQNLFYLGGALDSWDRLTHTLIQRKAPVELASELGLIRPSPKKFDNSGGPGYFDLFRNRVLFPILQLTGKIAGFGGRTIGDDTPKYLNSPESLVFQKSKLLFGLYHSQKYIREKDEVILVEGYFDVLAMHAAGFQNVVATCGTALTSDHLYALKKLATKVILLFDGDSAGMSATDRAMELGLDQGWVLYGARLPKNQDPDQILFNLSTGQAQPDGAHQMRQILQESEALLDSKINASLQEAQGSPEDRTQALKKIGSWLGRFQDPIGREVRMDHVQKQLGIPRELLSQALSKPGNPKKSAPSQPTLVPAPVSPQNKSAKPAKATPIGKIDQVLLRGILWGGDYLELFLAAKDHLPAGKTLVDLLNCVPAQDFLSLFLKKSGNLKDLQSPAAISLEFLNEALLVETLDPQVRSIVTEVLLAGSPPLSLDDFRGALTKRVGEKWAHFSQQIKRAINQPEVKTDLGLQARLMKEYLDVQRKMKEFSSFYDDQI